MLVTPHDMKGEPVESPHANKLGPAVAKPLQEAYPVVSAYATSWGTLVAAMMMPEMTSRTGLKSGRPMVAAGKLNRTKLADTAPKENETSCARLRA